ncbi:MAG TPA: ABC transporter permease [Desulfomonilia bacterium]|nr:ABC transporter permease [Deltaproteobacteria bacterium]HRS56204.1 ABC transporter permease [Desulfomonilia bacterium]
MRALDRKMLRDLWGMRGQALAIVFVILSGVATYVSMTSVMDSFQQTLHNYYEEYRFADGFATVRRAPELLLERIREVPGIGTVETRVVSRVNLKIEGFGEPVSGTLVSVPEGDQPVLNRIFIREGRLVQSGRENEVVLNEPFAEAHGLKPGDSITAIMNGRYRKLSIVGIGLSPEFLMQVDPASIFPDPMRYGVMWMGRSSLEAAYDMDGAFNDITFSLAPGAGIDEVIDRIDQILRPYGGQGAFGREDQQSHFFITEEFRQLERTAIILPLIFLGVAAFLLNIVISRLISLQREQIAVLKAFGYRTFDVGVHYGKLVLLIVITGAAAGTLLGFWLGVQLGDLYLRYYRFPYLEFVLEPPVMITAAALTIGAALIGVAQAVRRAVKLPPAEAMRPAPPAVYRVTLVERLGIQRFFSQPSRMIMRDLERRPLKALLTILGISSACAILIMGLFFSDSFDYVIRVQFGLAQREDVTITFTDPTSTAAIYELKSLPGVIHAEPFRTVPTELRHGHLSFQTGIEGIPQDPYLRRLIDIDLKPVSIPPEGLLITERLARILDVGPGDEVIVEVQEGRRYTKSVPVAGIIRQFVGVAAYMDMDAANRLAGLGQAISGAFLMIDRTFEQEITDSLTERPRVAGIAFQDRMIGAFRDTIAQTMLTYTLILSLFAGVITFGVVYNSARIMLSERDRELASLRVLGFTKGEVRYILLGQLAVMILLSIPLGLVLGAIASAGFARSLQTDMYQLPFILGKGTLVQASLIVLGASAASAMLVSMRLNRLDLIGVLKTRE